MTDTHPFRSFQRPPRPRSLRAQVRWGCSQSMSDRSCFPECQGPSLISPPQTSQQLCEVSEIGSSPHFPRCGKKLCLVLRNQTSWSRLGCSVAGTGQTWTGLQTSTGGRWLHPSVLQRLYYLNGMHEKWVVSPWCLEMTKSFQS